MWCIYLLLFFSDLSAAWSLIDEGETVPYALLMRNALINSAHGVDGEAYAVGASFLAISELSWVRPSSGCGYSNVSHENCIAASANEINLNVQPSTADRSLPRSW